MFNFTYLTPKMSSEGPKISYSKKDAKNSYPVLDFELSSKDTMFIATLGFLELLSSLFVSNRSN